MENINSYSEAIKKLEVIVTKLQSNDCKIDDLRSYTKESVELLNYCKGQLYETDADLKKLLEGLSDK